ncbi:MAG: ectoine/hydroxyectoine ABC transporter permease subunit EhuD [Sneathiella sp.]|uniref:ectoine/hydroxyectoine ABC transporter permease subunit EhuD n=1 Tax=Sneathiella sp. TaxID=1964365 RepID=UPI000C358D3A|nr:ectoine/hydroxyectoine ABC transporter permease subunit EhuD [Sneathiella sp.]MAZ03122.1 ectoine/hydroxyectoine ABC transporter permease subunit EhuD [Sneathiella sp.]|tara:strand:- start:857 stop:1525 length:669 start_codon:yes stop_codon:yes gene_type:complete
MNWSWKVVYDVLPQMLEGLVITVQATIIGALVAYALGLILAIMRMSNSRIISLSTYWISEFIRRTPLLVQLYFLFYVLPDLGIFLEPLEAGIIGLGLHFSTYTSEVFRAGIENVPTGQWEAAKSLNYRPYQTMRYVILPQAIPPMIPPLANYLITMFKETPLLSAITVVELFNAANIYSNSHYKYLEPMTLVGLFFLIVSVPSAYIAMWLERKYQRRYARNH